MSGRPARPVLDRLMERVVETETGCWEWQGCRVSGYGRMFIGSRKDNSRKAAQTHRLMYQELVGPIPEGLHLDHLCRNPPCCKPDHLEPVTSRENTIVRGVGGAADQARQTHCKRGHEFTPDNTYRDRHNKRHCRTCHRMWSAGLLP